MKKIKETLENNGVNYGLYEHQINELVGIYNENGWYIHTLWRHLEKIFSYDKNPTNLKGRLLEIKMLGSVYTLKKCILFFGVEEGTKRFDEYRSKQAETNSYEYKRKTHGFSKNDFKKFNNSRAVTLENQIKKHGVEEGTKRFDEYRSKQATNGCCVEWFVSKYGEKGYDVWHDLCDAKALTLENQIKKHGVEEGTKRYIEIKEKTRPPYSKISQKLFNEIKFLVDNNDVKMYYAENNGEYGVMGIGRYYYLDFYIYEINFCVEFNGDIFHANPKLYNSVDIPPFRGNKKTSKEIWDEDSARRTDIFNQRGIDTYIVWESDYNESPEKIIKEIGSIISCKLRNQKLMKLNV